MADVFEDRRDLDTDRDRLWSLIGSTPSLDWLLLTKRPEMATRLSPWSPGTWPPNVWLGTTIELDHHVRTRVASLRKAGAHLSFVSAEPLLGPLNPDELLQGLDWLIVGGETGARARPTRLEWVREIRDASRAAGIPFFFKQWGEFAPDSAGKPRRVGRKSAGRLVDGEILDVCPESPASAPDRTDTFVANTIGRGPQEPSGSGGQPTRRA